MTITKRNLLKISGCATLMYLNDNKMAVSLSFGRKVITNKTLSSKYYGLLQKETEHC